MKYVLVDLDHTLFHSAWRDHLAPGPLSGAGTTEETWEKYTLAGSHDDAVPEMVSLLETLSKDYTLIVVTAVSERFRALTNQRLLDAEVLDLFDEVLMRPEMYDGMPSAMLKPGMVIDYFKTCMVPVRDLVAFALEDRADVVEAYKALGITTLQVHVVKRK